MLYDLWHTLSVEGWQEIVIHSQHHKCTNIAVFQCLIGIFLILGIIGIALDNSWCEPISTDDVDACERFQEFNVSNIQNKMSILRFLSLAFWALHFEPCILVQLKYINTQNALFLIHYFNFNFLCLLRVFRTRGFIFRKTTVHAGMKQYVLHASLQAVL
jgi:hypothetical protein